jgi:hypothetical protein
LREVEAPTLLRQTANRWRQGCQPYAPAALLRRVSTTHNALKALNRIAEATSLDLSSYQGFTPHLFRNMEIN